jgi:hypothetical protein
MDLCGFPDRARRVARRLVELAPQAFVKVPFTPDHPSCLFVARDLERWGIPVNLTSTFSVRQVVLAALMTGARRTNVFMGRLDDGLKAERLGTHVVLCAQEALRELRRTHGVDTHLIVASMRRWRTFVEAAGCDVYTAPPDVLRDALLQDEIRPEELRAGRPVEGGLAELGVDPAVHDAVGPTSLARLFDVEPALVEFLAEFGGSDEYRDMQDEDRLVARFDEAGFGDLFHAADASDREEAREQKLPVLDGRLRGRTELDTHYSLLANADFAKHQEAVDAALDPHRAGAAAESPAGPTAGSARGEARS